MSRYQHQGGNMIRAGPRSTTYPLHPATTGQRIKHNEALIFSRDQGFSFTYSNQPSTEGVSMQKYASLSDLKQISHDPRLYREIFGFISACAEEIREYGDEEDLADHDFNITILQADEMDYLADLGTPEESAKIVITDNDNCRVIYRYIYPTEIIFGEDTPC
jgi:hypothetical protein